MNSNVSGSGGEEEDVKKLIVIFNFKQRLLSLDIKTKVVQHVPRINLRPEEPEQEFLDMCGGCLDQKNQDQPRC